MMFGLQHLFCWVPRRKSSSPRKQQHRSEPEADGKRRKRRRLRRYIHAKSGSLAHVRVPPPGEAPGSGGAPPLSNEHHMNSIAFSDTDYHDAVEFHEGEASLTRSHSSADGSHYTGSPNGSYSAAHAHEPQTVFERVANWWEERKAANAEQQAAAAAAAVAGSPAEAAPHSPASHPLRSSSLGSAPSPSAASLGDIIEASHDGKMGCMSLFGPMTSQKRFLLLSKPTAGSSFRQKSTDEVPAVTAAAWEEAEGTLFQVRSANYMRSKVKEPSGPCVYRLLGVDVYNFDFKLYHIAQHVQLPEPPVLGPGAHALPADQQLPPLLIVNLQLPLYAPSLFGCNDGPGHSLVYYFALPEGWEPSQVENKAALSLIQRFVHNKREMDGTATRDRLKLIARIVNVDEWAEKGPLSSYEHRLLTNYNDKPLLTRPQQRFYTGPNYLEIDLDVHNYAYIARKAFHSFISRLAPVVFENAFVVQGNRPEELPELMLAAGRVYRLDFSKARPFPAKSVDELGNGTGPQHDGEALRS